MPEHGSSIPLDPESVRHLEKVLRVASATPVTYTDGAGLFGTGTYDGGAVHRGEEEHRSRASVLTVAVAPPRDNARARFLVEKLAELGVTRLVWLDTAHREGRQPRLDKTMSWVRSAVQQSRGSWVMAIDGPMRVEAVAEMGTPVFAEPGGVGVTDVPTTTDLVLCVGPEGGFAPGEVPAPAFRLDLGANILRVETAAIVGAALLMNAED